MGGRLAPGPPPEVGSLGTWYANVVSLPYPGRSVVLLMAADVMLSVVAPGRSLGTTLPVFQHRVPRLLHRLGLPKAWAEAKARDLADLHVMRAGAETVDRRVLGTMNDAAVQIRYDAEAAGAFERLDLDAVEDGLADVPLGALGYSSPSETVARVASGERSSGERSGG